MTKFLNIAIVAILSMIASCKGQRNIYAAPKYDKIDAKVLSIDSTNRWYVIKISYGGGKEGVFVSERKNCKPKKNNEKITEGKEYTFYLSRLINASSSRDFEIADEDIVVWRSVSGNAFFERSENTCNLQVWNIVRK